MPFDLMYCPYESINELIKTNFKSFFKELKYDDTKKHITECTLNLNFNHDKDLADNIEALYERYSNRINNFIQAMESNDNILFIQRCDYNTSKTINELYDILKQKRKGKPFKYLIINVDKRKEFAKYEGLNPDIITINLPKPKNDYTWWNQADQKSLKGQLWELKLEKW